MYRKAPFLLAAAAAGVLLGVLGAPYWPLSELSSSGSGDVSAGSVRPAPSRPPELQHLADVIESLTQVLDDEINERRMLHEQLEQLKTEMADLKQNFRARVEQAFQTEVVDRQGSGDPVVEATLEERYAAVGITARQLESIRRLQAGAQMAGIELDDRARREGWINTPRYFEEAQDLATSASAIHEMLGDELYDRYLFTSGMPNRLTVGSVIESSPAQRAGLRTGDVILTYAGERVFSNQQLVDLRSSGVRGEPVAIQILRDGQQLQLTIPRGPMGIGGAPTVVDPGTTQD